MSRRKKRRQEIERTREGLTSLTTTLRSEPQTARRTAARTMVLDLVEDHRLFSPEVTSLPKLFTGSTASIGVDVEPKKGTRRKTRVPYQIAFTAPRETIQCVRRQRRKEVLHAHKKTGKGKGRQRKPRWGRWSSIKC